MPLISFGSKTEKEQELGDAPGLFFLGIWITDTSMQALLLKLQGGAVTLSTSSEVRSYTGIEDAVVVADSLLQQLGSDSEQVNDVIYIVDDSWIVSGDISLEKKPFIKSITTRLDLSPVGFVQSLEALVTAALAENPRYSGIFVCVAKNSIRVSVIDHAVVSGTEVVGRSGSITNDILEGLARFSQVSDETAAYLPPQITLVSLEETDAQLKEMQQVVLSESLTAAAKFLQPPTVAVITHAEYSNQVATAAGVAVADVKGLITAKSKATIPLQQQVVHTKDETANVRPVTAEELGFSEFVTKEKRWPTAADIDKEFMHTDPAATAVPTSFGIPISEAQVAQHSASHTQPQPIFSTNVSDAEFDDDDDDGKPVHSSKTGGLAKNTRFFIALGVLLGIVVVAVAGFFIVTAQSSAKVFVTLAKKPISTEATIEVSASLAQTDVENVILAADTVTTTVSGENTILTTGVKVVGENAKGNITLYNKTTADKDFNAGTVVSAGERSYTLDSKVTVPAAVVTETNSGEKKEFGTAEVAVTATAIGAEGNIAEETELTVASFADSTYTARALKAFEGGASREVRVVAQSDQSEAVAELQTKLEKDALDQLIEKAADGEYVLPSLQVLEKKVSFSSDVDVEVNEVTATVTLTVEALQYTAEGLQPLAAALLASQVPEGYVLSEGVPSVLSQPAPSTPGATESATMILANISSEAVPLVDLEKLYEYVLGKKQEDAVKNLQDYPGIDEALVRISPTILSTVPKNREKVELLVVEELE